MEIAISVLVVGGGLIALWLISKLLGGCLLRVLMSLAVLVLAAFILFNVVKC